MCHKIGVVVKQQGGLTTVYRVRCKSWGCPDCHKYRIRKLRAEAYEGHPQRFITVTVNPNWFDSPEERCSRLIAAWRDYVREFRRRHPTVEFEYLAVVEKTGRGEPHLHIMQRGAFIPQKQLSKWMRKRMGAPVVDVQKVRTKQGVAHYVTKYCSKGMHQFGKCKRYFRSQKWLKETIKARKQKQNAGATFWRLDIHIIPYMKQLEKAGYSAIAATNDKIVFEHPPWVDHPPGCLIYEGVTCPLIMG